MHRLILSLCFVTLIASGLHAQPAAGNVKKGIAPFNIQQVDGKYVTSSVLKKGIPVMIVYFDPDCDHCTAFISDLLKQVALFKQVQLVLITYVPLQQVKTYVKSSGLDKHPQIIVGTEGTNFVVRYYYNVIQFPYLALHDKAGKLISTFESEVPTPKELSSMF
jgi:hypothetical protein